MQTLHCKKKLLKRGLEVLLKVLKKYTDNVGVSETCCAAIGTVISSPETHSKYCTPEVIRAVEECYEKHKDSERIKQFLLSLKKEEDQDFVILLQEICAQRKSSQNAVKIVNVMRMIIVQNAVCSKKHSGASHVTIEVRDLL